MKNIAAGDVERYKKRSMQRNRNEMQIAGKKEQRKMRRIANKIRKMSV